MHFLYIFASRNANKMEIRISDELNAIIGYSREEAMRTGSYGIAPDHLMLGILRHGDNTASDILKGLETDLGELKRFIDSKIFTNEHIPYSEADHVTFSRGAQNVLSITVLEATRLRCREASSQHLLLALCRSTGSYCQSYLRDTGIDYGRVFSYIEKAGLTGKDEEPERPGETENSQEAESAKESSISVEEFGYDITQAARDGKLDPVVGRDAEIMRVIEILGRRKKNNPMLVGDPGVGKSAIVEGIALKIAAGDIPPALSGKRLISLDIASVVAGTRYRGDFEKRLKAIINEISRNPDIILFIDEFHTIVGAGGASGSLDAANMLKPALARGDLQCIGATTMEEFSRIVEKDGALDRRFQKIMVEPSDIEHTIAILEKIKTNYEQYHAVTYTEGALSACARLSDRYITDRCLPDKAIDALDEAGSMVRLRCTSDRRNRRQPVVTEDDIAAVISKISGIPVSKVAESEASRLLKMSGTLKKSIIGQDEAVDKVARAIQRNRAGIKDPSRPIGSFLFLGPTGVGKTQLAKAIAGYLFDSEDSIVRIDMSEYMEKFTSSRLVGAPPGYVGFEDGGQLSEKVRRKPYCVVLLDEIEKAHPDIFNLLLQILDEGRLTDSNGRTVNFRNTIVIMTSNIGSREIQAYGNGLGFSTSARNLDNSRKDILQKAVRKAFPPEFINRIDEQIFFRTLDKDDIGRIIDIQLRDLRSRIYEAGYRLNVTAAARKLIADAGFDPAYGARPLKRAIQRYIEDPVSEFIISRKSARSGMSEDESHPVLTVGLSADKTGTSVRLREAEEYATQL